MTAFACTVGTLNICGQKYVKDNVLHLYSSPLLFLAETKCLEFQEIKGLAGSSGHENVCVSSWSTPL